MAESSGEKPMKCIVETPVRAKIVGLDKQTRDSLCSQYEYTDGRVAHTLRQWEKALRTQGYRHWFAIRYGYDALVKKVEMLRRDASRRAMWDKDGVLYTYSGYAESLAESLSIPVERMYSVPEESPRSAQLAWPLREYQQRAVELLLQRPHAAVELATGLGKSLIIAELCRRVGHPTLIFAPTLSIANQLYSDLLGVFPREVGRYYDGYKEYAKKYVVAVSASLIRTEVTSQAGQSLANRSMIVGDESHLLPADTLSDLLLGLLSKVPRRYFLSGTQMRGDGLGLLLDGLIGPVVMKMTLRDGVEGGWLAEPKFFCWKVRSDAYLKSENAMAMTQAHLYQNPRVYRHASRLLQNAVANGRRPLVLLEHIQQFGMLWDSLPDSLRDSVGFAHGGLTKKNQDAVPSRFCKSNPSQLVQDFDNGKLPILVGTQACIGVGTDIKTADVIVDIVGLSSEVRLRQNIGRGARKPPGKVRFQYHDYHITNVPMLDRHAKRRFQVYCEVYSRPEVCTYDDDR